jgi:3-hydroxyisobutyrate dehydrogenase
MTRALRLGFVGLGLMGSAMTLRLLEKGWSVNVWNLEPERIAPMVQAGAVAGPRRRTSPPTATSC